MPGALMGPYGSLNPVAQARLSSDNKTLGILAVPPVECLLCDINIVGYNASDSASLRFNGDNGANYYSRFLSATAGGTTFTNTENTTDSKLQIATSTSNGIKLQVVIENIDTKEKITTINGRVLGTGNAATAPVILFGGGAWVNTTDRINRIELMASGSNNFLAGSSIVIYAFQPYNGAL